MNPIADEILNELRAATKPAEVHSIAEKHRAAVMAMRSTDAVRYADIVNLKGYLLWILGETDKPKYLQGTR